MKIATFLLILIVTVPSQAQEVTIAAAADLRSALDEIASRFQTETSLHVKVVYGSSGNLFQQIQNGAPFDLFFSANSDYPKKLEAAGLAETGTLSEYAVGRIVIWTAADAKLDVSKRGWQTLLDAGMEKIAIANPQHAPYGRAAVAALQKAGIYESVKDKLVYGENISQAAQFVQSGNAQAGIVALSLAVSPAMRDGKRWEIPAEMHPAIEQVAIVLKDAKNKDSARAFLEFVKSAAGRAILAKYGFAFPEKDQERGKKITPRGSESARVTRRRVQER